MTTAAPLAANYGRGFSPQFRAKEVVANGAATTLTLSNTVEYSRVTTSAASIAITFPATGVFKDGSVRAVCFDSAVSALTWAAGSGGATVVGAPSAAVANTPYRFIYDHGTTSWYPF